LGDLNQYLNLSLEQEVAHFHVHNSTATNEPDSILDTLASWTSSLVEKQMLLIRLQRYVSIIALKIPKQYAQAPLPTYSPDEVVRARKLNQEILAYEVLLGQNVVTSTPPNIQIEPTNRCNARCKPCPHSSQVGKTYSDLDVNTLHKIPYVLSVAQFVELFALGEPSIAPSFGHLAALCENQGCETHMITNGTKLLQNPDLKRIKKIGISLDGDNKETFETIRVGINFESLIESVTIFRAQNPEIFLYFTCTINRANILQIPGMTTLAKNLGLNAICFHRMFEVNQAISSEVLKQEDLQLYREKIEEAKSVLIGSNVLLFDYAILERSEPEQEPLNPDSSLIHIRTFTPEKDQHTESIASAISQICKIPFELYPTHAQLYFSTQAPAPKPYSDKKNSHIKGTQQPIRDIASLENRAATLKSKILQTSIDDLKIPYCFAAWSRLIVKADGRMFPCSCWSNTYANLKEISDFDSSWNGEFHQYLRDSFNGTKPLNTRCQTCPSIDRYQGLTEVLQVLKELGIDYDEIPKQPGFNPPPGKLQL